MKFRRNRARQTGRHKLNSDDLAPAPTALLYRARRSEETRTPGRQVQGDMSVPAPKHLMRFWLQRFGLLVLLIAAMASLINILSLSSAAKVVPLSNDTSRPLLRTAAAYQQAADKQLAGSIWNRNKITIDTNRLSQQLLQQFPELSSVSVTVPLLAHRPVVYVQPAQPALLLTAGNGSFIVDTTGKALLPVTDPAVLKQPNLPTVEDQNRLDVRLNHQALSADSVGFIQTVTGQLAAKQMAVSSLVLPAGASELDVHLSAQPYLIKFNLESTNPRGEVGTFLATISQLHRQNVTPSQYVDVRVDGRAYYK